ncbi:CARDB domain-containing protein, partial [Tepidiforma sp.]|uniref:CARDB domain-containing protein n=1 Tax=Tepidiforma sp. TaxID=2682230 RepID=UPI002ADDF0E7
MLATRWPAARLLLPAALLLGVAVLLGGTSRPARALAEADVDFTVTQSPAAPATVQVGSTVTFTVAATVNTAPVGVPLFFELDYPAGLTFVEGYSSPAGVTCTNNVPAPGVVRCDYGNVSTGPRVPLTLNFTIDTDATTAAADARMRAGASDGAPDSAAGGGDSFTGAGTLTVFSVDDFAITSAAVPGAIFEGRSSTFTVSVTNNGAAATGPATLTVTFPGGLVSAESCSTGTASATSSTVTCSGVHLAPGSDLTITATVAAPDSADGADIAAVLDAPGLGIPNHALSGITVHEVGLINT